jgi:hypothetical protein
VTDTDDNAMLVEELRGYADFEHMTSTDRYLAEEDWTVQVCALMRRAADALARAPAQSAKGC